MNAQELEIGNRIAALFLRPSPRPVGREIVIEARRYGGRGLFRALAKTWPHGVRFVENPGDRARHADIHFNMPDDDDEHEEVMIAIDRAFKSIGNYSISYIRY